MIWNRPGLYSPQVCFVTWSCLRPYSNFPAYMMSLLSPQSYHRQQGNMVIDTSSQTTWLNTHSPFHSLHPTQVGDECVLTGLTGSSGKAVSTCAYVRDDVLAFLLARSYDAEYPNVLSNTDSTWRTKTHHLIERIVISLRQKSLAARMTGLMWHLFSMTTLLQLQYPSIGAQYIW